VPDYKHVITDYGTVLTKAVTYEMILINVPGAPDDPSYKTSPINVITPAEVVGSMHEQIAVGLDWPACYQTPVKRAHMFELASSISVSPKIAWAIWHASTPTVVNCSPSKAVFIALA